MTKLEGTCRAVFEKGEWVAIATNGTDGPHLAGTWGEYIRGLGIQENEIRIPVAGYRKTEQNLAKDNRIELLCGTRLVDGAHGPGKGCRIRGTGQVLTSGELVDTVKSKFSWARGVLVIKIEEALSQL
jgi:hypothetical protein